MLSHARSQPKYPDRVVVLGATGVVGRPLLTLLNKEDVPVLGIGSADINLEADDASNALAHTLQPSDALVFLSALTPDRGRDVMTAMRNLRMGQAVCAALERQPVAQVIYMSSDAVYPMGDSEINEASPAAPRDLYGAMHLMRETMMDATVPEEDLAILRLTMVISPHDTHNGYGPNRFRMQAMDGRIVLNGGGEETRDYIADVDVARVLAHVLSHGSHGILNCVSGRSYSFQEVADLVAEAITPTPEIDYAERLMPITHRRYDTACMRQAFPGLEFETLAQSLARGTAGV